MYRMNILLVLLCCNLALATQITVTSGAVSDIITAVTSASHGDVIMLSDGMYIGCTPITISKNITIYGSAAAVIQCYSESVLFRTVAGCDGAAVVGITIRGATTAIEHIGTGKVMLSRVTVSQSVADCAVIVRGYGSELVIDSATVTLNNHTGICVNDSATAYITSSIINRNRAVRGGGVAMLGSRTTVVMVNTSIYNNTADNGGGIYVYSDDATVSLTSCVIHGNIATINGGGMSICGMTASSNNVVTMYDVSFTSNTAQTSNANGGGIYAEYGTLNMTFCTLSGNHGYDGGALALYNTHNVTVYHTYIISNTAGDDAGGVKSWGTTELHMYNTTLSDNTGQTVGLMIITDDARVYMDGCTISDNHAIDDTNIMVDQYAVFVVHSTSLSYNSGYNFGAVANFDDFTTVRFYDCVFNGNHELDIGGGVMEVSSRYEVLMYNCSFLRNTAYYRGGVAYLTTYATVNFTLCTFRDNIAESEYGGVFDLYNANVTLTLWSCTFSNNTAYGLYGGAIYSMAGVTLTAYNTSFINNHAVAAGSVLYMRSFADTTLRYTASFTMCDISYNTVLSENQGAVYIANNYTFTMTQCTLTHNVGGALSATGQSYVKLFKSNLLTIASCIFTYNTAYYSAALMASSLFDAGRSDGVPLSIVDCDFSYNSVSEAYGAILLLMVNATISNVRIIGNSALHAAGLAVHGNTTLTMASVNIWDNDGGDDSAFEVEVVNGGIPQITGTNVTIERNHGCGLKLNSSAVLMLDTDSRICRNTIAQLCNSVVPQGTAVVCGTFSVTHPVNIYGTHLYPGMTLTVDDGVAGAKIMPVPGTDVITTIELANALLLDKNDNAVPFNILVPAVTDAVTGPITLHTESGTLSQSFEDYTFHNIHIDDCNMTLSTVTGPLPYRGVLGSTQDVLFNYSSNCIYLPVVRCYYDDVYVNATVEPGVARCTMPIKTTLQVLSVTMEVTLPNHVYNYTSTFEYYYRIVPTTVSPSVAHTNITNITVCGIDYHDWAAPRCLFSGHYYENAQYIGTGTVRCVVCRYYSPEKCGDRVTNTVAVSVYEDQASDYLTLTHVCLPRVDVGTTVTPSIITMSTNMTQNNVSIIGYHFVNGPTLSCRFGDVVTSATAPSDNLMYCQVPLFVQAEEFSVMVEVTNDGQNWVSISAVLFTDGVPVCEPGYENRESVISRNGECMPCNADYYKSTKSKDMCTQCGDHMKTLYTGSTNKSQCMCDGNNMTVVGDYDSCTCNAGYYYGGLYCVPCAYGYYKNVTGLQICDKCGIRMTTLEPGSMSFDNCTCSSSGMTYDGADGCICMAGRTLIGDRCDACPHGTFKQADGDDKCTSCGDMMTTTAAGSISIDNCTCASSDLVYYNSSLCICKAGTYLVGDACMPCSIGKYKPIDGNGECFDCPYAMTTVYKGSVTISECRCSDTFVTSVLANGTAQCVCPAGTSYGISQSKCLMCDYGSYSTKDSMDDCVQCDVTKTTQHSGSNSTRDCVCRPGYFNKNNTGADMPCMACYHGAKCNGGDAQPVAAPGYYKSAASDDVFLQCQNPTACVGSDRCIEGYEGYVCAECSIGWYKRGSQCIKCDGYADVLLYMAIAIIVIVLCAVFAASYKPSKSTRFAALRIGWSFIQVTSLYAQFDLKWPPEIQAVYRVLSFVILDIQVTSPECSLGTKLDFYLLLKAKMLLVIAFMAVLSVLYIISTIIKKLVVLCSRSKTNIVTEWVDKPSNKITAVHSNSLSSALIRSILMILIMFYIPLCQFTLQYFACTYQDDGTWTLNAQPSLLCYSDIYNSHVYYALWGVVAYMIGIPVLITVILRAYRERLYDDKHFARFGFLASRFKPDVYYWEVIICIRMCLLIVVLMMLNSIVPLQTMSGIVVLFAAHHMQVKNEPFISNNLNSLESLSLVASILTLLTGQVFYSHVDNDFVHTLLIVLVLTMLAVNAVVIVVVVVLQIKKDVDDPFKDIDMKSGSAEVFTTGEMSTMATVTGEVSHSDGTLSMDTIKIGDQSDDTHATAVTSHDILIDAPSDY